MPLTRHFIDPQAGALPMAVDYLFERFSVNETADLGNVVVVLPGGRAGRRLLEILVDAAEHRGLDLVPPEIRTVGSLPELLYTPGRPFASELTQQLAWAHSLAAADRTALSQVVSNPPDQQDVGAWRDLGQLLSRTHRELAADGLDFDDVVRATGQVGESTERDRWSVLRRVQQDYLDRLDALELWDRQTARLTALDKKECATNRQIVLVGAVDINQTLRQMLDDVADQVTALVPARSTWTDRFDRHGCLLPEAWQEAEVGVPDERIHLADDPTSVADSVVRCIAGWNGRYRADEITVGLPDERIAPQIERALQQCNLPARWGPGRPLTETGPCQLLQAIGRYVGVGRYEDFAALVRHPDVFDWLGHNGVDGDWLTELDGYFGQHLPARFGKTWLGPKKGRGRIERVASLIDRLLRPLNGSDQPLGEWSAPLSDIVRQIYSDREFDREVAAERAVLTACQKILSVLQEHETETPPELMPRVSAETAVRTALDRLRSETLPAPADRAAIELLGWLELSLDDAPAMIVTNVNEGLVPAAVNADLLLPDTLRRQLGLEDNTRRFARDAYALSVILAARDDVELLVARRNADNDPLSPSRLLFAADDETIARRALRFFDDPPTTNQQSLLPGGPQAEGQSFDFPYLKPQPLVAPITSLSPTGFRSYLACPYRFYLQYVLRLESLTDDARELDGASFGTLLHEVLRRFGESPHRDSTDADELRRVFHRELDKLAKQTFGPHPLAAVSVQVEQARLRLDAFAHRQAEWARQWRIEHTELYVAQQQASLVVDGAPFYLRGRIDRVDVHRETGERVVLDYKSSDTPSTPEKSHQTKGEWVDLQLPLYRHLAGGTGLDGPLRLGYVQLPRDVKKIEFQLAEWTDEDLASADDTASAVIRSIREEQFWPPTDPPPAYSEQFAWICHDGVFDKPPYDGH